MSEAAVGTRFEILDQPPYNYYRMFCDVARLKDGSRHLFFGGWYWIRVSHAEGAQESYRYVLVFDNGLAVYDMEALMSHGIAFRRIPEAKPRTRWPPAKLLEFLGGKEPNPGVDSVYDMVLEAYKRYIDYPDPRDAMLLALYTIQTYLMPVFHTTAYILFTGAKRSGKSRNLEVAEQLVFNPIRTVDMTPASLFRIIEDWQATMLIDESDLDFPDTDSLIRRILLAGYKRGNTVARAEKTKKERHIVEQFDVFGPKMIVAPFGVSAGMRDQMLFDRCIPVIMERTANAELSKRRIDPEDPFWPDARHHLYLFALKKWREVEENYLNMPSKLQLISREYEKWAPLFAIAECFGLYDELEKYCREKVGEVALEEEAEAPEIQLLRYLIHHFSHACEDPLATSHTVTEYTAKNQPVTMLMTARQVGEEKGFLINVGELAAAVEAYFGKDSWTNSRRIGRIMTSVLGFNKKPYKTVIRGKPHYWLTRAKLEQLAEKYGVSFEDPLGTL